MMWSCLKQETPGVTRGTSGPLSFSSLHTLAKILFKSRLEDGVTAESWTLPPVEEPLASTPLLAVVAIYSAICLISAEF